MQHLKREGANFLFGNKFMRKMGMELTGKKITFLGDSITAGRLAEDINNSYFEVVKRRFQWEQIHNFSVPGARIGEYIGKDIASAFVRRYVDMPDGMDIVVVFGGSNDFGIGNAPLGKPDDENAETFYGAVNILMKGLKTKYPEAIIIWMTPLHRKTEHIPNKYSGAVLSEYVDIIKCKAAEYGLLILDMQNLKSLQPTEYYYSNLICSDGIHPNDVGHVVIAEEVIKYLRNL